MQRLQRCLLRAIPLADKSGAPTAHYRSSWTAAAAAAASTATSDPPKIPPKPHTLTCAGNKWTDEYDWLRHAPEKAQQAAQREAAHFRRWARQVGADTLAFKLRTEMLDLLPEETSSPPERVGDYVYYVRQTAENPLPTYLRCKWNSSTTAANAAAANAASREEYYNTGANTEANLPEHKEQVVVDLNELSRIYEDISLEQIKLSKCGSLVAFTLSESQGRDDIHKAFVRHIPTGKFWEQPAMNNVVSVEWAADGHTLLFTQPDRMGRPYKVLRVAADFGTADSTNDSSSGDGAKIGSLGKQHALGNTSVGDAISVAKSQEQPVLILQEDDPRYFIELQRSKDWELLMININSKLSSEVHILPADDPAGVLRCVQPRRPGLEYFIEHHCGNLYIMSNARGAENYALYTMPLNTPLDTRQEEPIFFKGGEASWEIIVPERPGVSLEDLDVLSSCLVLHERHNGTPQIRILPMPTEKEEDASSLQQLIIKPSLANSYVLPLPQWGASVTAGANADYYSNSLRLELSSPVHPDQPIDWNLRNKEWTPLPEVELYGYSSADFICDRLWAPQKNTQKKDKNNSKIFANNTTYDTPDITLNDINIPITIAHAHGLALDGSAPCLVVVYGAYGHCLPTDFLPERVPLLRRGWVVALVHARGGGELGRRWHAAGRGVNKSATADDVEAAIEFLIARGYSREGRFSLEAASAGGVAAGTVLNRRPGAFSSAILEAPFLDVLSTMCDPSLPLTQHEYDEFGDPSTKEGFEHVRTICPYSNIRKGQRYPPVLLTCSQSDQRVPYWGPIKCAARLRAAQEGIGGGGGVLVVLDAHEGHLASERERYNVKAAEYAFLLLKS